MDRDQGRRRGPAGGRTRGRDGRAGRPAGRGYGRGAARRPSGPAALAAALAAALLAGCSLSPEEVDNAGPQGGPRSASPYATMASPPAGTPVFDADHRTIVVTERWPFTIALEDNPSTGYRWAYDGGRPDPRLMTATGDTTESDSPERTGSGATRYLHFRAKAVGRTAFTLRHCYQCGTDRERKGKDARGGQEATELRFTVTVRADR